MPESYQLMTLMKERERGRELEQKSVCEREKEGEKKVCVIEKKRERELYKQIFGENVLIEVH
jgi:hypothetical protein